MNPTGGSGFPPSKTKANAQPPVAHPAGWASGDSAEQKGTEMKPLTKILNPERFYIDQAVSTTNQELVKDIQDCLERSIQSQYGRRLVQRLFSVVRSPYEIKADCWFKVVPCGRDGDDRELYQIHVYDRDNEPILCICPRDGDAWPTAMNVKC